MGEELEFESFDYYSLIDYLSFDYAVASDFADNYLHLNMPLPNYAQAINYLQKAVNMGVKEASIYLMIAHLYQNIDMLKQNSMYIA